jgi:hypothetical protein
MRYIETYTHQGNSGCNQFFASGTPEPTATLLGRLADVIEKTDA